MVCDFIDCANLLSLNPARLMSVSLVMMLAAMSYCESSFITLVTNLIN